MLEKRFIAVAPQFFLEDGTTAGQIKVTDSTLFKVKQEVVIMANGQTNLTVEIKRIDDEHTMHIGPIKGNITTFSDLSAFTVSANALIFANEQKRPSVPAEEITRAVYEEEPIVATRVIPVNRFGGTVNLHEDGIVPQEFDDVILTRDLDGDITNAKFYRHAGLLRELELSYDLNKDVVRVRKI